MVTPARTTGLLDRIGDGPISDDELAALALAADPNRSLDDAVPFAKFVGDEEIPSLPEWYMPAPMGGGPRLRGWRRGVVFLFIASLLTIEAFGLCSTYGQII